MNVKLFTVSKQRYLRAQNLIIDIVEKSVMGTKREKKKKGNKRILIRTYFNYSIEAFELFGGSYRVHQSDYTQVKEKKPIH